MRWNPRDSVEKARLDSRDQPGRLPAVCPKTHGQVKLITRNAHDWTKRHPWTVHAARRIRSTQLVLDGEACILGVDGVADFDDLHSQKHDDEVQLYAFDLLSIDGDDLRDPPLHLRKNQLSRLLARRVGGVQLAPFEEGEIGPDLFKALLRARP